MEPAQSEVAGGCCLAGAMAQAVQAQPGMLVHRRGVGTVAGPPGDAASAASQNVT